MINYPEAVSILKKAMIERGLTAAAEPAQHWVGYFADFDCRSSSNKPKATTSEPASTATYCRPLKLYVIGEAEIA
jgi:hypothetical protein